MIGQAQRRKEDDHLVTGRTTWTANVRLPGLLHVTFLRSPVAHGRITRLDVSTAREAPGVVAVLTGEDLALGERGFVGIAHRHAPPHQPLAIDTVRYPGEPVAAVVALDAALAQDALALIEVDYDPLPVVGDALSALESPTQLHEGFAHNVAGTVEQAEGDVAAVIAAADVVVRRRLVIPRVASAAMEPRAVVAAPEGDGYTVWTSTQTPHIVRYELARAAGMPESALRVVAPDVGGGFGSKVCAYGEDLVLLLASRRLGAPVTWTATRSEDLATTAHGRVVVQDVTLAADSDGRLRALDVTLVADIGAYVSPSGPGSALDGAAMYPGIYRLDAFAIRGTNVFTNRAPVGAYRGAGRPEATYAIERMVDELAAELGLDPVDVRRRSWATDFPHTNAGGVTYDVGDYDAATDRALELLDYAGLREEQARRRASADTVQLGIGVSTYTEVCGSGWKFSKQAQETASVRLLAGGGAEVVVGTTAFGTGHTTSWSQLVSDVLGVPFTDVRVVQGDTATSPDGYGSYGSRSLIVGGTAIHEAAVRTRTKATALAAEMLEADAGDLELVEGVFRVKGTPTTGVTIAEVALKSYADPLDGFEPGLGSVCGSNLGTLSYPAGTHLAAVEVDTETGMVRVRRFVAVDDVGVVVNPMIVDGQVHGGLAQGIGEALYEEMAYDDDGNLVTPGFSELTIPAAADLPPFVTDRTCTPSTTNPLGAKGAGETGAIGSTPAVVNAVLDALRHLGVRDLDMPCTPERVWRALATSRSGARR